MKPASKSLSAGSAAARANAAVFYYLYDNKQPGRLSRVAEWPGDHLVVHAKGGTGYGAELDLDYQLVKSLRLSVNMGYVKTRIKGPTEISDPRQPASSPQPLEISGQPFAFAPEWTGSSER